MNALATISEHPSSQLGDDDPELLLPVDVLLRVHDGVFEAAQMDMGVDQPVKRWIEAHWRPDCAEPNGIHHEVALSFADWKEDLARHDGVPKDLANLILALAYLRQTSRADIPASPDTLAVIWSLIHRALTSPSLHISPSRSSQGFLSIPLYSRRISEKPMVDQLFEDRRPLVESKPIQECISDEPVKRFDELIRLHVWLPDGERGVRAFAVHSHQPWAQSWVLVGKGANHTFRVERCTANNSAQATHEEYAVRWSADGRAHGEDYKPHQTSSKVVNTGVRVCAREERTESHTRDMSYTIPENTYHLSEVDPDAIHATLFFFDSSRGFDRDARVLGPPAAEYHEQPRNVVDCTTANLVDIVDATRRWELFIKEGRRHARRSDWEHALRAFESALDASSFLTTVLGPQASRYRHMVLADLGNTNRRFGRYSQARQLLEGVLVSVPPCPLRIEACGELGVVYRHLGRLDDARRVLEEQYATAAALGMERDMCRAVGNLGMVNYQLSQERADVSLLATAIEQQQERILVEQPQAGSTDSLGVPSVWEIIGLSRLSLCYIVRGDLEAAAVTALEGLNLAIASEDSTAIAMSRFFHGRALLHDGRWEEALTELTGRPGACSPAMAFCKEPSEEHRGYIHELLGAGVHMDSIDEHGYTALDYAVFSGDAATEQLILEGLRRSLGGDVDVQLAGHRREARLRKGHRELFQEEMRPVLLASKREGRNGLGELRRVYRDALAADDSKSRLFDRFKFVPYADFKAADKLPRSIDGLTKVYEPRSKDREDSHGRDAQHIVFFSYRWINHEPGAVSPDDAKKTQYRRMLKAIETFLAMHPSVDGNKLGILDTCVDQESPEAGVSALPMNLAQCDAVISLVDEEYYTRAWCCVEVLMVQRLRRAWGFHAWYECDEKGTLHEGRQGPEIEMEGKLLSYEEDRPKVAFLERQSGLLG
ncbi:hypothetical protein BV20DRAFT_1118670 [Pilatotrama ljubarskyi]|nr:hypothetical protein BV20DRAFT_1118670 [Pilatotrama ljubarskyi]